MSIFKRSSGWIDLVFIFNIDEKESKDGIDVLVLEGYSTFVNKQKFLCLRFREKDHIYSDEEVGESVFYIFNYERPSNDKLVMKPFSEQKVKELIKEGKLKGDVVKRGQHSDKVTVTSSSDDLIEVISREDVGALFEQDKDSVLVFSRSKT
ncbi:MAG: hypothetical protein CEE38_22875 [Planctomycetes bacterium B3_Pla]|nr:MAG: hypothetical protein CEE38_22875 [Planctomycetes bacterium B3_Pla]